MFAGGEMTTTNANWYKQNDKKQRHTLKAFLARISEFFVVSVHFGKEEGTQHYRLTVMLREKE
jgi:hypothetical protein